MDDDPATPWIAGGACAVAAALAFSACTAGATTVCPAIGWSNTLTVGLADDWPDVPGGSLPVECSSRCGDAGDQDRLSDPLTGRSTVVQLDMTSSEVAVSSDVDLALAGRALRLAESLSWRWWPGSAGATACPCRWLRWSRSRGPGQRGAPARTSPTCG